MLFNSFFPVLGGLHEIEPGDFFGALRVVRTTFLRIEHTDFDD